MAFKNTRIQSDLQGLNLIILLVLSLFVERYSIYNPFQAGLLHVTRHLENYPGTVVGWSAVNFLFKQDGVGQFGSISLDWLCEHKKLETLILKPRED